MLGTQSSWAHRREALNETLYGLFIDLPGLFRSEPLFALPQGVAHGLGQRFAGQGGDFASQPIGFVVFDLERGLFPLRRCASFPYSNAASCSL